MKAVQKKMTRVMIVWVTLLPLLSHGQEGIFLREEEAPKAVFPDATSFDRRVIPSTAQLREKIAKQMGRTKTSLWEDSFITFIAKKVETILGYAVIVEEIGKHRPITFIVGVDKDNRVRDAAVMVYREPYGGEVRDQRFLTQYQQKSLKDPLLPFRDIRNISGATLSVEAIGRGIKKALALAEIVYLQGEIKK